MHHICLRTAGRPASWLPVSPVLLANPPARCARLPACLRNHRHVCPRACMPASCS